jgi:hypothetical protein
MSDPFDQRLIIQFLLLLLLLLLLFVGDVVQNYVLKKEKRCTRNTSNMTTIRSRASHSPPHSFLPVSLMILQN